MEDLKAELDRTRRQFLEAEAVHSEEKACLIKIINTFGMVVDRHREFAEPHSAIREKINEGKVVRLDLIQKDLGRLRSSIFAGETRSGPYGTGTGNKAEKNECLYRACRNIKRIMLPFLEDFYPMTTELKKKADEIDTKYLPGMAEQDLDAGVDSFLVFVKGLKEKVSEDFRYLNKTFLTLLNHVKELERMLSGEFNENDTIREIEHFEIKINQEMGSIAGSFDVHKRISEIRSVVVGKLGAIKNLVAERKKEEIRRSQRTSRGIDKLKKQIVTAEKQAFKMSRKAEHFKRKAERDGLTGLYNRRAFDERLKQGLNLFNQNGGSFMIVIFDVDNFKSINDTFCHVAGDKVLKVVARTLLESFRKDDFIARYGGDEFVVILEGLNEEMVHERAENFIKNFSEKRFTSTMAGKDIEINISAGIASAVSGEAPDEFIRRADLAMYDSKKNRPTS